VWARNQTGTLKHMSKDALMVLPLFRKDQWETLRATSSGLHDTWEQWNSQGEEIIAKIEARDISYVQVPVDVAELQQYCEEQGFPNDPAARCAFVGFKHKQMKKPVVCAKVFKESEESYLSY
jgi:hypothetical protein